MIGILGLQGDVSEHRSYLLSRYPSIRIVKKPSDLIGIQGLVLPGGESTTMTKLIRSSGLEDPVRTLLLQGLPVWGTCAGTILLSRGGIWPVVEAEVERNAYGTQLHSRVARGRIAGKDVFIPMVFIRAPKIVHVSNNVEILALDEGNIVAVRQGNAILTTFHPELTPDEPLFVDLFLNAVTGSRPPSSMKN